MLINERIEDPYTKFPPNGPLPQLSKTVIKSKLTKTFWEKTRHIYDEKAPKQQMSPEELEEEIEKPVPNLLSKSNNNDKSNKNIRDKKKNDLNNRNSVNNNKNYYEGDVYPYENINIEYLNNIMKSNNNNFNKDFNKKAKVKNNTNIISDDYSKKSNRQSSNNYLLKSNNSTSNKKSYFNNNNNNKFNSNFISNSNYNLNDYLKNNSLKKRAMTPTANKIINYGNSAKAKKYVTLYKNETSIDNDRNDEMKNIMEKLSKELKQKDTIIQNQKDEIEKLNKRVETLERMLATFLNFK